MQGLTACSDAHFWLSWSWVISPAVRLNSLIRCHSSASVLVIQLHRLLRLGGWQLQPSFSPATYGHPNRLNVVSVMLLYLSMMSRTISGTSCWTVAISTQRHGPEFFGSSGAAAREGGRGSSGTAAHEPRRAPSAARPPDSKLPDGASSFSSPSSSLC